MTRIKILALAVVLHFGIIAIVGEKVASDAKAIQPTLEQRLAVVGAN